MFFPHPANRRAENLLVRARYGNRLPLTIVCQSTGDVAKRKILKGNPMLYWAVTFFIIAIIAAVFGFGGIASASAGVAQILFVIFIVLFIIAMVMRVVKGRSP